MAKKDDFSAQIRAGYTFKGEAIKIGRAVLDGSVVPDADIMLP